ncbi:trichothecene 3-O-acetyltransferas-like protein [Lindgomyces ingoldianus]|uniref:Trichothecene 3-O-acetyltransferas-like protein n=1 Tax=Lindgomyces ingoldianus TaxID=673940 RepID=A0ACB6QXF1_9PLEO|nr:trichothecene 3-O-acetyltransferas-like protein [Lindgomyces ingoldianus]KAF2471714.1 trichothecene 3-O-acetyltransferas-like protein [Lindgomyces ingoldianus]
MISRMAYSTLHLSLMDQSAVRAYIRNLLIFPFPDMSQAEDAVNTLREGFQATVAQLPYLAGTLGPVDPESGRLTLRYPKEVSDVQDSGLFSFDMILADRQYTYERLKKEGMPPSAFPGTTYAPRSLRDHPGMESPIAEGVLSFKEFSAPVLGVHAFFIPGGLVLSMYLHHSVSDGTGMNTFYKHFAENVRLRRNMQMLSHQEMIDHSIPRFEVDERAPVLSPGQSILTVPLYIAGKWEYDQTLPENTKCTGRLFVVPAARIRAYRDSLRSKVNTPTPLTVFNVLASLVWIHVTRARAPHWMDKTSLTTAGIAVDLRRRLSPKMAAEFMGNMALFTNAMMPKSQFVAEVRVSDKTIIPAVECVNASISGVDNEWVNRHLAFFNAQENLSEIKLALRFKFASDMFITSWMNFGAEHEWCIPGAATRSPEFIRKPHSVEDGGIIIMPRRRGVFDGIEAPYEVLVQLAGDDMERLLNEEGGLATWAEHIVE